MHSIPTPVRQRITHAAIVCIAAVALLTPASDAAAQRRRNVTSPEVGDNGGVTLRYNAPGAERVEVWGSLAEHVTATEVDDNGVWTITLSNVEPEVYEYGFLIDGVFAVDALNPNLKQERTLRSLLVVPSDPPGIHDRRDVPRGSVHGHEYRSATLGGVERRFHVYTPPGYERSDARYPVLYLLHGSGDNDSVWASTGRAAVIADNLIAERAAVPMIIVMPHGHAAHADREPGDRAGANRAFAEDLTNEVMPRVERLYRTRNDARSRALMGLSMGGGQTLSIGLTHPDTFAWLGAFSASVGRGEPTEIYPALADPARLNDQLELLWIGCGSDDFLFERNNTFTAWLKDHGVEHTYHVSDDVHNWACWRRYLAQTLPMLFRDGGA